MCAVAAVDVEGRVGFGEAFLLGLFQCDVELFIFGGHISQDVVAGSVYDSVHSLDVVGHQSGAES